MLDLLCTVAYAEGEQAAAPGGNMMASSIIWLVAMIAIFYFLLIRPQKKQEKKTKAMLDALQVGDKIVTIGGICGKVTKLKDEFVYIETGFVGNPNEKTTLKMERSAIKSVLTIHEDEA